MDTFIYIEQFQFNDPIEKERFYGHPKTGKVYKAYREGDLFRVPLESKDGTMGIMLAGLSKGSNPNDTGKWSYSICEVNEVNIGDLDISMDDLEIIDKEWIEGPKKQVEKSPTKIKNSSNDIRKEIENENYSEIFFDISENLNDILDNDKEMFFVLADVIKTLADEFKDDINKKIIRSIINDIKTLKRK